MSEPLKNLKAKIEHILKVYPQTRNSDVLLTRQILHTYESKYIHKGKDGKWWYREECFDLVREDSVKRLRASIQNSPTRPQYLPTTEIVRKARNINEETWRKYLGYNPELREVISTLKEVEKIKQETLV